MEDIETQTRKERHVINNKRKIAQFLTLEKPGGHLVKTPIFYSQGNEKILMLITTTNLNYTSLLKLTEVTSQLKKF